MQRYGGEVGRFGLTALRAVVGLLFVLSGLTKVADRAQTVADFSRWGVPLANTAASAVGALELIAGALLVLGMATRWVALSLLTVMVGAVATAGVTDGGQHLALPPVLALLCALFAVRGGGAWQLLPRPSAASRRSLSGRVRPTQATAVDA